MDKASLYNNLNEGMLDERYGTFNVNLKKNLPLIRKYGGMSSVVSMFKGKHVVVVGAGPSMTDEIIILKKYIQRETLIIISVDVALPILNAYGIKPHFVISCETRPMDFASGVDSSKIHLLAFSCMSNSNVRKWSGSISFYNWLIHKAPFEKLWDEAGKGLGFVASGSIVTTQAISIALACDIKSIFLIGNDLGFDHTYYAKNSSFYLNNLYNYSRFSSLETREYSAVWKSRQYYVNREDKRYFTNHQFLAAKYWLEELFGKTSIPVYDNSVPGCGKNVEKLTLKKYCEKYLNKAKRRRR